MQSLDSAVWSLYGHCGDTAQVGNANNSDEGREGAVVSSKGSANSPTRRLRRWGTELYTKSGKDTGQSSALPILILDLQYVTSF